MDAGEGRRTEGSSIDTPASPSHKTWSPDDAAAGPFVLGPAAKRRDDELIIPYQHDPCRLWNGASASLGFATLVDGLMDSGDARVAGADDDDDEDTGREGGLVLPAPPPGPGEGGGRRVGGGRKKGIRSGREGGNGCGLRVRGGARC